MNEPGKATLLIWFIAIALLTLFALALLLPGLLGFFYPDRLMSFDQTMIAQLTTLVTGLVWFAIGSSQGSRYKDAVAAETQAKVLEVMAPAVAASAASVAPAPPAPDPPALQPELPAKVVIDTSKGPVETRDISASTALPVGVL